MTATLASLQAALADRYRVERELGAGGMAVVYLAHDLRHDRHVALKVLRAELSAILGAERFLKEIRTTANLQHPHILPLHDSGEAGGVVYYVMPYVEGESLRDRLSREKQLPVDEAVRIGREVAGALDYAHRHGVVHRDIKPENILLHDGQALVADFGIALAAARTEGSTRLTETGMSLGTPQYMAPEQAMGEREVTPKADIYALGCVVYEMLAGEPPFTGPTAQAIIARVMTEEPRSLTLQRRSVPPHVEAAVLMALEKLPADRFASAAQLADALANPGFATTATRAVPAAAALATRATTVRRLLPWGLLALAGGLAAFGWLRPRGGRATGPSRLAILVPGLGGSGGPNLQRQLALTPDGGTVIFTVVNPDGSNSLMRQDLDAAGPVQIGGSTAAQSNPLVSPDGRWLIATSAATGRVWRFPIGGGTGVPLPAAVTTTAFAGWGDDGALWVTRVGGTEVIRVGGDDVVTTALEGLRTEERIMQVLPDGRTALVIQRGPGAQTGPVGLLDLRTGEVEILVPTPVVETRYTSGQLLYVQGDGSLMAVPFDARRRRVTGTAVTIATGVGLTGTGFAQLAVASNGTVAYIPEEPRSLVVVDRGGTPRELTPERRNFHHPLYAPDGRRLSVDFTSPGGRDVWILTLGEGTLTRATFVNDGHDATWTPDGRFLTFLSARSGVLGIYRTRPGSAEPPESLLATPNVAYTGLWLRDGRALVTVGNTLRPNSQLDIGIVRNEGRGPIEPLVASPFAESYPAVSLDGRWLAFVSDQSGEQQVYVRPLDRDGDQVQVSQGGGNEPLWSRDGRELFYRGITGGQVALMVATVRTGPDFAVTTRRTLFLATDLVGTQPHASYDVTPDGRGFVMVRRSPATRIMVIQNLTALVDRLRGATTATR